MRYVWAPIVPFRPHSLIENLSICELQAVHVPLARVHADILGIGPRKCLSMNRETPARSNIVRLDQ